MSTRKHDQEILDAVFGDGHTNGSEPASGRDDDELRRYRELATLLSRHGHREPHPARESHLWNRLEQRLDEAAPRRSTRLVLPALRFVTVAAAVTVIGFAVAALLRTSPGDPAPTPAVTQDSPPELAVVRLDRLLERTTPLLLALSNRSVDVPDLAIDTHGEQRLAARLAAESRTLREDGAASLSRRDRALVAELEGVLLQVANTPSTTGAGTQSLLRQTIEDRQLLFEIALRDLRRARAEGSRDV